MEPKYIKILNDNIPDWKNLEYETVGDIITSLQAIRSGLYPAWAKKEEEAFLKRTKKREDKKKNFEKNVAPRILTWAKENLKSGMMVIFDGCRDQGCREISELDWESNSAISWQLRYSRRNGFEKTGIATTNSILKIKRVFVKRGNNPHTGEWKNIRDFIKL